MTEQPIARPNASAFPLEDLVGAVLEGKVRIPDFQRGFRWQWEDVKRLLDSIVRGYPIGSLLLWARPAKATTLTLGALEISAPETGEALWVVDGQQRLTSLASALSDQGGSDPRFAIAYDLSSGSFRKTADTRPHVIPLPVIFDLKRLLKWFSGRPESGEYFDEATRVAKAIREYSIPAYVVKHQEEKVLRDIFDRMNNYGKRLTRAEVFSALHAGENGSGPPHTLSDIVDQVDGARGFGVLDEDTVLYSVLARRGPDVTRDIRAEFDQDRVSREFPRETVDDAYQGGERALIDAVAFLQDEAGVPHFGFLTYRYLLVILTRFFAHHPDPGQRNRRLLRRWFWRAAMAGPERLGGWTPAMRSLASHVSPDDEDRSIQGLLGALEPFSAEPPSVGRFRSTAAYSRILLCTMWNQGPRSVLTGEVYERSTLTQALEGRKTAVDVVFKILKREPDGGGARAANRLILLGDDLIEEARQRFANPPLSMTHDRWSQVLDSHCLNDRLCNLLMNGEDRQFLDEREAMLSAAVRRFLAAMTESEFEDTPPLDSLDLDDEDGFGKEDAGDI